MRKLGKVGLWMAAVGCAASLSATLVRGVDGLAAYYPFEGEATDASGSDRHGTAFGPTAYAPGKIGEALDLKGGAYIQAPALNTTGSVTVSGWVMTRSANTKQTIAYERAEYALDGCGFFSAGNYGLGIYPATGDDGVETGRFAFATATIRDGECVVARIVAPDAVVTGQFYCVTAVYDHVTSSERLYVNGNRVSEEAGIGDTLRTRHDAVLRIGINHPLSPQPWDGLIDDFRVYDRALTDDEVGTVCGTRPAVLSWTPSDLIYGESLGAAQLNATSDVEGTFHYSLGAGALLTAGTHEVCATFSPADTTQYDGGNVCRDITVHRANTLIRVTGGTFDFDGQPHGVTVEAAGPLGPVGPVSMSYRHWTTGLVSPAPPATPGVYHVTAEFAGDANHEGAAATGILTIGATARTVKTLRVGNGPFFSVASPDGTRLYVANDRDSSVSVINTVTDCVIATLPLARQPGVVDALHLTLTPDGSLLYTVDENVDNAGTVTVISTETHQEIASFPVQRRPTHIAARPDGAEVYVINDYAPSVSVIGTSDQHVTHVPLPGRYAHHVAFSGDSQRAYITKYGAGYPGGVIVLDTASRTVVADLTTSAQGGEVYPIPSPDGTRLYLKQYNLNAVGPVLSIISIDRATDTYRLVSQLDGPVGSLWMNLSRNGSQAYLFSWMSPIVQVLDAVGGVFAGSLTLPAPAWTPVWDHDSDELYVPHRSLNSVSVINGATGELRGVIDVGRAPVHVGLARSKKYVSNYDDGTISVIASPSEPVVPCACDLAYSGTEDIQVPISLTECSGGTEWRITSGPAHGSLSGQGPVYVYTPDQDYHGPDQFTYVARAGNAESAPATVSITLAPVNDAPRLLLGGPYAAYAGTPVALSAAATDPEGDSTIIQWDLDGDGQFEAAGGQQLMFAPATSTQLAVRATDAHGAATTGVVGILIISVDPQPSPGPIDPYFEPRPSFIVWDTVVGRLRADYGPRFAPEQLATTCAVASGMLGHIPLWHRDWTGFVGLDLQIRPNYPMLVAMQRSLPPEFKYVGLGYAVKCARLPIPDGAELARQLGITLDCELLSRLYTELTGETPEETLANALPIPDRLKEIIRKNLVLCPFSLNLSEYDCEERIEIAAELAEIALPGLGLLLNSPVGKFLANALLCGFGIDIPDMSFEFPDVDWGFGKPGCWFGCRSGGDDGGGGDGDGGDGGDGSGDGSGSFNWDRLPSFGGEDWDWTTLPPAPPIGPGNYVECALLPAEWQSMTWRQLVEFGAARGASPLMMMDVLAACTLTEPVDGLPFRSDAAVSMSGPSFVRVGDVAVYELSVRTTGPAAASLSRVMVTAATPFEVLPQGASCRNLSPTTARCDFGNVAPHAGRTIPLSIRFALPGTVLLRAGLVSYVADANLADNTATLDVTVEKRVPAVGWAPATLVYGAPIGAAQLNAVADVSGTFDYSLPSGTRLPAGTHRVSVVFTPGDVTRFETVTTSIDIEVIAASLTISVNSGSREFGAPNPALTVRYEGLVNGDTSAALGGALAFSTTATLSSPVGAYPITASGVSSPNYEIAFVAGTLRVVDTTAPVISEVRPSEATLWAPNHRMVPVTLSVTAADATSTVACSVVGVSSNEAVNGTGDGDLAPDWTITGPLSVQLRAERSGGGSGRIYTVRVQCQDAYGNASSASTTVAVPHSKK